MSRVAAGSQHGGTAFATVARWDRRLFARARAHAGALRVGRVCLEMSRSLANGGMRAMRGAEAA